MVIKRSNLIKKTMIKLGLGRQLVMVDVQKCFKESKKILKELIDYAKGFDEVIYIYDTINLTEDDKYHDMFKELKDSGVNVKSKKISKEFGFFRDMIDADHFEDEQILDVIELMMKMGIDKIDGRENEEFEKALNKKNSDVWGRWISRGGYEMWIPELKDKLKEVVKPRPILVGGGKKECLKEVYLLLKATGLNPTINEKYTY